MAFFALDSVVIHLEQKRVSAFSGNLNTQVNQLWIERDTEGLKRIEMYNSYISSRAKLLLVPTTCSLHICYVFVFFLAWVSGSIL